jgi:biotin transport system ATP-binding protein
VSSSAIDLDAVSVRLGEGTALEAVTLRLDAPRIAVIGENGSGKSTFARVVAGLIPASSGRVRVLGLDPVRQSAALRPRVAMVFSNPDAQIVMPTVAEDVAFSLRPERLRAAELNARVAEAVSEFGLTELAGRSAHELSGGQKQLLALCGAFIRRPELVIADEPTAALDARNSRRIADHLFAETGHRLVIVTHDLDLAAQCDVVVLFAGGRVSQVGTPDAVIAEYEASLRC